MTKDTVINGKPVLLTDREMTETTFIGWLKISAWTRSGLKN